MKETIVSLPESGSTLRVADLLTATRELPAGFAQAARPPYVAGYLVLRGVAPCDDVLRTEAIAVDSLDAAALDALIASAAAARPARMRLRLATNGSGRSDMSVWARAGSRVPMTFQNGGGLADANLEAFLVAALQPFLDAMHDPIPDGSIR